MLSYQSGVKLGRAIQKASAELQKNGTQLLPFTEAISREKEKDKKAKEKERNYYRLLYGKDYKKYMKGERPDGWKYTW